MSSSSFEILNTLLGSSPLLPINILIAFFAFHFLFLFIKLIINQYNALKTRTWCIPTTVKDPSSKKILILGDSTSVGAGANQYTDTIAGRLEADFPHYEIVNLGKNGGLVSDVVNQVNMVKQVQFDTIFISVGGNDVWHLRSSEKIRKELIYIFGETKRMSSNRVFFLLYNIIEQAPMFPYFMKPYLAYKAHIVNETIIDVASKMGVPLIDLFVSEEKNPFTQNPKELFSSDGIHPSSRGYALWYYRLWRKLNQIGYHS